MKALVFYVAHMYRRLIFGVYAMLAVLVPLVLSGVMMSSDQVPDVLAGRAVVEFALPVGNLTAAVGRAGTAAGCCQRNVGRPQAEQHPGDAVCAANSIYPMTTAVISMTVTPGILFARHIDIPVMTVCDAFIIEFMACIISIGVCLIFFMLNPEKDSQTAQMLAVFMCFCIVAVLPLWTEFEAFGLLNAVVARVGILVALIASISGCRYVFGRLFPNTLDRMYTESA